MILQAHHHLKKKKEKRTIRCLDQRRNHIFNTSNSTINKREHTWSWLVMLSCWHSGAKIVVLVFEFEPVLAYELCVVSHEYRSNGSPSTWNINLISQLKFRLNSKRNASTHTYKQNVPRRTTVVGMTGFFRVQRVLILPLIKQFSQCRPSLQFLSNKHVCPCYSTIMNKNHTKNPKKLHQTNWNNDYIKMIKLERGM